MDNDFWPFFSAVVSVLALVVSVFSAFGSYRAVGVARTGQRVSEIRSLVSSIGKDLDDQLSEKVDLAGPICGPWRRGVGKILQERGYVEVPTMRDSLAAAWGTWVLPIFAGALSKEEVCRIRFDPQFLRLINQTLLYDNALALLLKEAEASEIAKLYASRWGPGVPGVIHLILSVDRSDPVEDISIRFARYGLQNHVEHATQWLQTVKQ